MAEQRAKPDIAAILIGEFLDHLGPALGVGAIILGHNLDHAAIDAAAVVDQFDRGLRGAVIPAAIGGTDASAVHLKPDLDRRGGLRMAIARPHRQARRSNAARKCRQRTASGRAGSRAHFWAVHRASSKDQSHSQDKCRTCTPCATPLGLSSAYMSRPARRRQQPKTKDRIGHHEQSERDLTQHRPPPSLA